LSPNIWQTFAGPYLRDIVRQLWPPMAGVCLGIWLGAGLMTGVYARYGTLVLGVLLVSYAAIGLGNVRFHVARAHEHVAGGIVGLITGFVAAFTGVQVILSMPFVQAVGMERTNWSRRWTYSSPYRRSRSSTISTMPACSRPQCCCRLQSRWPLHLPACLSGN
jgi:hypothetical protein